uniref:Peptidoglycan binding-like domain-containing protein n=1 Tax=Ananas comosus var. bracteatus TaxID=296719 RepID=A0A6V7P7W1_ANACO|nr:unnamed protein product [Ananas comosus var. bracteatus]
MSISCAKEQREVYDVAVARAVAELRILAEYCLPLVRVGGLFVAAKGYDPQEEIRNAQNAIRLLGGSVIRLCDVASLGPFGHEQLHALPHLSSSLLLLTAAAAASASAFPDLAPPSSTRGFPSKTSLAATWATSARPRLKDYLSHFGYLPSPPPFSNFSDSFDEELDAAIRTYQHNFGLNVTGTLDPSTVDQMIAPRCGVADVINGTSTMNSSFTRGRNLFAYFAGNPTWPPLKRDLKYALTATSNTAIDKATLSAVLAARLCPMVCGDDADVR